MSASIFDIVLIFIELPFMLIQTFPCDVLNLKHMWALFGPYQGPVLAIFAVSMLLLAVIVQIFTEISCSANRTVPYKIE